MDVLYGMPGHDHRLFINVVHACPNACYFCVDFIGDSFYGFDLKLGKQPSADEIVSAVEHYADIDRVREVYYCGIGEPLLRYQAILESAPRVRKLLPPGAKLAINTSGTFFLRHRRVDFAEHFDLIQVSLNAESEEKYNQICRPKHAGAYEAMMSFLRELRRFLDETNSACHVELSVVDASQREHLPSSEQGMLNLPQPDVDACRLIASGFRWPLKVKPLMRGAGDSTWEDFADAVRGRVA